MKKVYVIASLVLAVTLMTMCNKAAMFDESGYDDRLSGGAATVFNETSKAFSQPVDGLTGRDALAHGFGDHFFEQTFVSAPSPVNTGLGPIFNNVSCISCHHNDGKGTPTAGTTTSSLLFRISLAGVDAHGGPVPVPGFGNQVQDVALFGVTPEAGFNISYTDTVVSYPDGSSITLRKPAYQLQNPYTSLAAGYLLSPRLAPPVFGLGLLANIPESTILSFVDAGDKNRDGISGKANYVYNPDTKQTELGRFGLKANTASLLVQVATAYQQDMGVTSSLLPVESCYGQSQYDGRTDDPELADTALSEVVFYVKTLAVPARRDVTDADNKAGEKLFAQINCSGCHRPTIQTGVDVTLASVSNQRIHPYTDLLLHDMGSGLADNRPDFLASGTEWRTAPLWGIGLFEKTNGIPYFLHDGRARSIEEAILWHNGEAKKAKEQFMQLGATDRARVLKFLKSL